MSNPIPKTFGEGDRMMGFNVMCHGKEPEASKVITQESRIYFLRCPVCERRARGYTLINVIENFARKCKSS